MRSMRRRKGASGPMTGLPFAALFLLLFGGAGCASETYNPPPDVCSGSRCDPSLDEGGGSDLSEVTEAAGDASCVESDCRSRCLGRGYTSSRCNPSGSCSCLMDNPGEEEVCGDGIDNNGNGGIDEGCACTPGDVQPCFSGPPAARGVGPCMDGFQVCRGIQEFMHWGPCEGEVLPVEEACDGLDNDCDGMIDEEAGCSWSCTPGEFAREYDCSNQVDDDCDGLIDCADPDCSCCVAQMEICGNGLDEDCDTLVDCADPDCTCCTPRTENCSNGVDDDCDGRTDCYDVMDCLATPLPENCSNGIDDDCDGQADCNDPECCTQVPCGSTEGCNHLPCCVPGTSRWCDTPSYCSWGTQLCGPDYRWGTCTETSDRPPGCESYYFNRACCESAGQCCQNYPYDDTSIGNCGGIARLCP